MTTCVKAAHVAALVRPELRFKSATNEWPTPDSLWKPLDDEFGFTLDVCSTHENAKCANHYTLVEDGLKKPWFGVAWMNPPYGAQLARWVKKCHDEAKRGVLVVGLIPVRSNTSYWHEYVMGNEIRFVRGYPKFGNAKQGLKAPLAVVVWRPNNQTEAPAEGLAGSTPAMMPTLPRQRQAHIQRKHRPAHQLQTLQPTWEF